MTTMDRRSFLIQGIMTMLAIPLVTACKQEEDPPEQEARAAIHLSPELLWDSIVDLSDEVTYTWGQAVVRNLDKKIIS